jgi:hypothetical protein
MAALDTDKRAAGSRKQSPEMIADDAIGTAKGFLNGPQHSVSSPCIWHTYSHPVLKVPWWISRTIVETD